MHNGEGEVVRYNNQSRPLLRMRKAEDTTWCQWFCCE